MTHSAQFRYANDESARLEILMDGEKDSLVIVRPLNDIKLNDKGIDIETARQIVGKVASEADVEPEAVNQTLSLLDEIDASEQEVNLP